ncbi:sensor histidine kinase [Hydrogenimonas cancrithermarum]|uniref:histidine kinase n=1 Tax=Hydrogenimonas cancrithermarum TaxID=2993563 RepID=A0ABN6WYF0_9BACT|nr:ATP-binding protein [Hydrogenimonas cancrithermarum]BDY13861.1 two-component sensor histidine kinase [Hydrogenimonas cancrithermarum]
MNEFKLPASMKEDEKQTLLSQLENLIEQTYSVEKEYITLTSSYNQLQSLIKQIIEALPNALWVINEDGSVFLQNSEAESLEGLLQMLPPQIKETEVAFDGRHFLVKSTHNEAKTIISATDITEQKRKERLASMGQMAAHLAHEIRNPIGSIALLVSSLAKRVVPKNQPIVDEIRRSLFRVERIIKTTLMYSKGVQPNLSRITLDRLEQECRAAIASYSYTKEIHFHFDLSDHTIEGDLGLLSLALQNLLFNAIDAIEESDEDEGSVWIKTEEDEAHMVFTIEDSGIPLENPENLFEAFQTTKTKGNGLGLVLARQIVEAHGGRVEVQSAPKQFRLFLPASG